MYMSLNPLKFFSAHAIAEFFTFYGGGKGRKAPKSPDFVALAKEQAASNLEAARVNAKADRVDQYTPYGSVVWDNPTQEVFDEAGYNAAMKAYKKELKSNRGRTLQTVYPQAPNKNDFIKRQDPDRWRATVKLSPAEQAKLDVMNSLEQQTLGYVQNSLFNGDGTAKTGIDGKTVQEAVLSRLRPQLDNRRNTLQARMAAQGVMEGSEGYRRSMQEDAQNENDLLLQAALRGIDVDRAERDRPLNVLSALKTGNPVQYPSFVNVPGQQPTAGPDLLSAASSKYQGDINSYNARQASGNGLMSAIGQVGGAYLGNYSNLPAWMKF